MIQAIETMYKGYRFRSRLEARWAVFFDAADIPWEYEKQGFTLSNGSQYLPDFWIPLRADSAFPGAGYWLEIKGQSPSDGEKERCRLLAVGTGHCTYLVSGAPGDGLRWKWYRDGRLIYDGEPNDPEMPFPEIHFWTTAGTSSDDDYDAVNRGIRAARSARFEHGESGASAPAKTTAYKTPDYLGIARAARTFTPSTPVRVDLPSVIIPKDPIAAFRAEVEKRHPQLGAVLEDSTILARGKTIQIDLEPTSVLIARRLMEPRFLEILAAAALAVFGTGARIAGAWLDPDWADGV